MKFTYKLGDTTYVLGDTIEEACVGLEIMCDLLFDTLGSIVGSEYIVERLHTNLEEDFELLEDDEDEEEESEDEE